MITKIRLELSDWLYNAGVIGVVNILEAADHDYTLGKNYVEFDSSVLDSFAEDYFNYFFKKYIYFTSWWRIVDFEDQARDLINNIKSIDEDKLDVINKYIENTKTYLTSASYRAAYEIVNDKNDLLAMQRNLKRITITKNLSILDKYDEIQIHLNTILSIIDYLKTEEIKKMILAKNIIYTIINNFWQDVSFLNSQRSKYNPFLEYKNHFLKDIFPYVSSDIASYNYSCFTCSNKIKNKSRPNSYNLTWISATGVDTARKTNHFWNYNNDVHICPICNLVYSCIPAGFNVIYGKGIFINENADIKRLKSINQAALTRTTSIEELEQERYYSIIEYLEQASTDIAELELDNIQIVKLDTANNMRPYTFNILSRDLIKIIWLNRKRLDKLVNQNIKTGEKSYINLHPEVMRRLYNNQNLFDLLHKIGVLIVANGVQRHYQMELIIKINNIFLGGIMKSKSLTDKQIGFIKVIGTQLQEEYKKLNAENKIPSISHKLLNSLKTKNISRFMDTILNTYMYAGKPVPSIFLEGLKDEDVFQTIGYAFLLGLQGEQFTNKVEG